MNLYQIETKFLQLFNIIEDNDGEIDEQVAKDLEITEDQLKEKLTNYYKMILQWKADAEQLKCEKNRIADRQKSYEKRVEVLSKRIIEAINKFGDYSTSKTKSKFIELPDARLSTRNTDSVELDEDRIKLLINACDYVMTNIYKNGEISLGDEADIEGLLGIINAAAKAGHEMNRLGTKEFVPFTLDDLDAIHVNATFRYSLTDFLTSKSSIIETFIDAPIYTELTNATTKTSIKPYVEDNSNCVVTVAMQKHNQSLQIK